ncbi:MAG: hypothetical protein RLZZ370_1532 [Bacteroidota bacterium]
MIDFLHPNWLAIFLATLSTFVVGTLWYNPKTLGNLWMREAGIDPTHPDFKKGMGKIFGGAFFMGFLKSYGMALLLPAVPHMIGEGKGALGIFAVFLCITLMITSYGTHYLFERRSLKLFLIHAGHDLAELGVICLVLWTLMRGW